MRESEPTDIDILYDDGSWVATHDSTRCDGPVDVELYGRRLVEDYSFYLDDMGADSAVVDRFKAFRKGGAAVVQTQGHFPFGAESEVRRSCRYAANHVRITTDLRWRPGDRVKRHLGIGSLFLPGRWRRYYCVPPCLHLAEGAVPAWHPVPEEALGSGMIGHWHRPPLTLVFERDDGVLLEVGTGDDLWRWEQNLGFGPEAASFKVMSEAEGLRIVREPLMTCEEVAPRPRDYRFTSYLAWWSPQDPSPPDLPRPIPLSFSDDGRAVLPETGGVAAAPLLLDLAGLALPETCRRVAAPAAVAGGGGPGGICWRSHAAQKAARRVIRQLAGLGSAGALVIRGLTPGPCWDARHVDRPHDGAVAHWDLSAILDFGEWTRQQLGPDWLLSVEQEGWEELPALRGLARENGFRADFDEADETDE